MAANTTLKDFMVKVILEFYKQELLVSKLDKQGIYLKSLLVKNLEVVFDVIGFPKDNSEEYDIRHEYLGLTRDESKKLIDADFFADDWLQEHYYDMTRELSEEKKIIVTEEGIDISEANNLPRVSEKIAEYIDWLYEEYEKYKSGEKPWNEYFKDGEE